MTVEVLFSKSTDYYGNLICFSHIVNQGQAYMDLWTTPQSDSRAYEILYVPNVVTSAPNNSYTLGWNNYPLNTMVKITYLKSGTTYKTYVDGKLMDMRTISDSDVQGFSTNVFFIGKAINENEYYFTGDIYSIRVYNKALTDQEIIINNNLDKKRFGF